MGKLKDLTGQRFGYLVAKERARTKNNRSGWLCQCDCGNTTIVVTSDLTSGNTRSCGCYQKTSPRKVGDRSSTIIPMIGKRFGRLVVKSMAERKVGDPIRYICQCDCGNITTVLGYSLRKGNTVSCGCYSKEVSRKIGASSKGRPSKAVPNLVGKRFGSLFVLEREKSNDSGRAVWKCLCNCGKVTHVVTSKLLSGKTKSCGCLGLKHATEAKIKHGKAHSPIYNVFHTMHARCENPRSPGYKWYGGKGVQVCSEWEKFEPFYAWAMDNGYEKGLTIDRIDPDGNYCPENCRWISRSENSSRVKHKK